MILLNVIRNRNLTINGIETHYIVPSLFGFGFVRSAYKFSKQDIYSLYVLLCEFFKIAVSINYKTMSKTKMLLQMYNVVSDYIGEVNEYIIDTDYNETLQRIVVTDVKPKNVKLNEK